MLINIIVVLAFFWSILQFSFFLSNVDFIKGWNPANTLVPDTRNRVRPKHGQTKEALAVIWPLDQKKQ